MQRLCVLSGHVAGGKGRASPFPCAVSGKKTITVRDSSTGKSYEVSVSGDVVTTDELNKAVHGAPLSLRDTYKGGPGNHVTKQCVRFIGAGFAEGQNLEGTEMTPPAMRDAGLQGMVERLGWNFSDAGDLAHEGTDTAARGRRLESFRQWLRSGTRETYSRWAGEEIRGEDSVHVAKEASMDPYQTVKNGLAIGKGCGLVHDEVLEASSRGEFALTIGGDHSLGSATIGALVRTYPQLSVIWVDAHADANTPDTSPSNHYHGMPVAHVMGWFKKKVPGFEWLQSMIAESRIAYIGLRDIDPEEGRLLQESGVHVFTMALVDRIGIAQVMDMALSRVDPYHNRPLHLSFDIDAIDPVYAPGTGTLARGGLTYRESHYICEEMASTNRLVGMDLVEVNPLVDHLPERMHGDDVDMGPTTQTVSLAMELVLSSLGKNIMNTDV